jgi:hypothetical protein
VIDPEMAQNWNDPTFDQIEKELPDDDFVKELDEVLGATKSGVAKTTLETAQVKTVVGHDLPLTHNPLHDLESIYWLLLYILGTRRLVYPSPGWNPFAQKEATEQAFPAGYSLRRESFFLQRKTLGCLTDTFDPTTSENSFSGLNRFRAALMDAYILAEEPLPEPLNLRVLGPTVVLLKRAIMFLWDVNWPEMQHWSAAKADDVTDRQREKRRKVSTDETKSK